MFVLLGQHQLLLLALFEDQGRKPRLPLLPHYRAKWEISGTVENDPEQTSRLR